MAFGNVSTTNPYRRVVAITTSDATAIATGPTDAILVTTTGNVVFLYENGNVNTITGIPCGVLLPLRVSRVNATGTTATASALYYV